MPEFATDLLSGVLVIQLLPGIELNFTRATRRWRLPSRQHFIPHLRIPMPQPMHVAQPRRLALSVIGVALLNETLVRRVQRTRAGQLVRLVEHEGERIARRRLWVSSGTRRQEGACASTPFRPGDGRPFPPAPHRTPLPFSPVTWPPRACFGIRLSRSEKKSCTSALTFLTTTYRVVIIVNMKAELIHQYKSVSDEGIIEMKVWKVLEPVPPSEHEFKYRLVYIVGGVRVVGYDNERGKGDHCHLDGEEYPYAFISVEQLIEDFIAQVERRK